MRLYTVVVRRVARNSQWEVLFGGSGGRSLQRLKILRFFAKITQFYGYFDKI